MIRLRVVVLFGGRSVEREVSRISARTIVGGLDPSRYDVVPLAVGEDGRFLSAGASASLLAEGRVPEKYLAAESAPTSQALVPAEIGPGRADVVFPIIHGSTGALRLNAPIAGMVRYADGYLMVASDGGIFDYSREAFLGSLGDHPPSAPIVGVGAFTT